MSCPCDIVESLQRYVDHGVPTGSFLQAVLENDLKESFARADDDNRDALFEIVNHCYNEIPGNCWGSPEKVEAWLAMHEAQRTTPQGGEAPC